MKTVLTTTLTFLFLLSTPILATCGSGTHARLLDRAHVHYEHYEYAKAVAIYERVITDQIKNNLDMDMQSALRLAESYQKMNDNINAEKWYKRIAKVEELNDQQKLNYTQVLLKLGKEKKAKELVKSISNPKLIDLGRIRSLGKLTYYYGDSMAYYVENVALNSEEADFGPAFYRNGIAFVSNRPNKQLNQNTYHWDNSLFLDLYFSENDDANAANPLSKTINTSYHEGPAVFFDNDEKVIFTRNNFHQGKTGVSSEGVMKMRLYYAEKDKKGAWSKPSPLPFTEDEYSYSSPTWDREGTTLYFHADLPSSRGKTDIFKVAYQDGVWGEPESVSSKINTREDEKFPFVDRNNVLYFASSGHAGIGGLDIYKVDLNDPAAEVINMGYPINTSKDDFGLIIKEKEGYFASNRPGGKGSDDIYKFICYAFDLNAQLIDAETQQPLKGTIKIYDKQTGTLITSSKTGYTPTFSSFRGKDLLLEGSFPGFQPMQMDFSTDDISIDEPSYTIKVPLGKNLFSGDIIVVENYGKVDQVIDTRNGIEQFNGSLETLKQRFKTDRFDVNKVYKLTAVYYDFDQSVIRPDAAAGLDRLMEVMERHPSLTVTLSGHTDLRGDIGYNNELSKNRVDAAKKYLLGKGLSIGRIVTDYQGELRPVRTCIECDEDARQLNRRTEIYLN